MNRFRQFIFYCTVGVLTLVLLGGIYFSSQRLNQLTQEHHLRATGEITNAPPIVTFTTVALGSFRGLLADLLWLRTSSLQDEGNYFEMVQLASWITMLQPHFTGATAYLAWNMAYNISVTCSTAEERWRWIQRGIELIRDEALTYNPEDPLLYKELGWIYQHKIGNIMDDANLYYKTQIANAMTNVFGAPAPDWQLWAQTPQKIPDFLNRLSKENRTELTKALETSGFGSLPQLAAAFRDQNGKFPEAFTKVYDDPAKLKTLATFLRVNWLVSVYKLNPQVILEINNQYGVLDWRLPESQAIYWAIMGLKMTPSHKDINCERMITQSLKDAFMGGRLLMVNADDVRMPILTVPNLNVVDSVRTTYLKAYEENKSTSFRSALLNFMKDAVVVLYNFGNYTRAQQYLNYLKKEEPGNLAYDNLDLFVLKEWAEDVRDATPKQANDIVAGLLFRSCNFLVYGDMDAALAHERLAKFVYDRYMRDQADSAGRMGLAPYNQIKEKVTQTCLKNFPPALAKVLQFQLDQEKARLAEQQKEVDAGRQSIPSLAPVAPSSSPVAPEAPTEKITVINGGASSPSNSK